MGQPLRKCARYLVPLLLGCLVLGSGCSVVEEIDKIGKDTKPPPPTKKQAKPGQPGLQAAPQGSARAKLRDYYNRKPAEQPEEDPNNPIVRCDVRGSTQFMRKHDCTLRGGRELG